ncbi:MAG: tetratricopeptide repeat protein [Gammaproteobacteria bacterium]|nr:tetratricopeptide repeat protein [Gammaproteobacteria bacterium]
MNSRQLIRYILLLAILSCFSNSFAVVPQRIVNIVYPSDETIASFSKVINAGHLQGAALADVYRERGIHYSDLGHYAEAVADFTNAIKFNSAYVTAYINRANAYAKLEQYEAAYQDFATAQKLSPNNQAIYVIRGSLNFLLGRFGDAAADYRYYLLLKPGDMYRMLWLHLSEKYLDINKPSELAKYARNMNLDVWPGALIKLYLGQVGAEDFLDAYKKNINSMSPEYLCEGFYYLGQYFLLTGNRQLAADSFRQAVKSNATKNIEYEFALAYLARLAQ